MWKVVSFLLYVLCSSNICARHYSDVFEKVKYQYYVEKWLNDVEADLSEFNSLAAHLTWKLSTNPDDKTASQANEIAPVRNIWRNRICSSDIQLQWLTDEQKRKLYLLCRGPKYTNSLLMKYLDVSEKLAEEYNSKICFSGNDLSYLEPIESDGEHSTSYERCFYGEPDLERLIRKRNLTPEQLKWIWLSWHNFVGPRIKGLFEISVMYQNEAAIANGYHDMGQIWREELEIPDLKKVVVDLYNEIKPLFLMLHAVVRHKLYLKYGPSIINPKGLLPAHLLGNMWGQDWTALIDLFISPDRNIDLDSRLKEKNITVKDMVREAEDFYTSLGFPKMTQKFWEFSIFEENNNISLCHGTAANLYSTDDYRMLMCGKPSLGDMYVIHHEMGHIEYYMAYEQQSAFFQDGTNTAFHESIGDAVWHGVMAPQHLHRLRLLTDDELIDDDVAFYLLLYQALNKLPELPFALLIDEYRWKIFDGTIKYNELNKAFWELNRIYRGIEPPEERSEMYFDAGAKFHIPDNTPYIRYFLSSILQLQLFKQMCESTLYGISSNDEDAKMSLPLQRCDIYGSKRSGKLLLRVMEKGSSIKFSEALKMVTGSTAISTEPFLEYYKPVNEWLEWYIKKNDIVIGW